MNWMILTVALCNSAWARTPDGDDEKKNSAKPANDAPSAVETLSAELKAQRAELEAQRALIESLKAQRPEAPAMSLEGSPFLQSAFTVSFTDGFHLKSGDEFDLHIGGRVEVDYREIFDRPILPVTTGAAAKVLPNTFFLRELFLTMDGTIYRDWGFKLNEDFSPQGANATAPANQTATIPENSWLEWKHFREFRIQAGQFKSPCEVETLESPLFTELVSRSLVSRFVENQDIGMNVYGDIADGFFTYQIALQNGRDVTANSGRSLNDDNDGKEWGGRFTLAPFVENSDSFLKGLRVGVWGSYGREGQGGRGPGVLPGTAYAAAGFQTTEFGISFLEFPATFINHGLRVREGGELTYAVGPFEVRGEVLQRRDHFDVIGPGPNIGESHFLAIKGYYAQVTYILTGEEKIPDARISPKHNFEPWNGQWGAFELAARYSGIGVDRRRLNDLATAGNIIALGNSNHVSALTLGVNWWFTKNVKLAVDMVHEHYDEGVTFADTQGTQRRDNMTGLLTQFQIDF